ncbi:DNA polymerase IV [Corynebacterium sanguinis]|uniref:DNA polymerase IV n=1 Tax=Corynebacterium sanguinis TaxID=2594913 RepID=UPI0011A1453F|nr:DNA polymerase IV [Corynebacterium sanguinis]MCT1554979.1 DNA polymerase IV [Corynebacterium sanguinis]MCT1663060.1 DNA polymerase IV [Corynebacterium sanguinis]TVS25169.1 DNA polymerase IV [Corynebacterium sanguinis]
MSRWVLHIDMDAFYASCEQLTRPTLKGRPVLVAGVSGRGVVAGASYEARKYGARSAMPTHRAARLVGPKAVLVAPRRAVYTTASRRVFEVIARHVDVVEQLSIDEAFMEPAELADASPDDIREWANRLRAEIKQETGLPSSIGAGSGKQYAKIGSGLAKPDGVFVIPREEQLEILHPLPVNQLWGVGPVTEAKLASVGIETIGDFAALSEREVEIALGGAVAKQLWGLARGIDNREVAPRAEAKQISSEHTYPQDLTTPPQVDEALKRAAAESHRRLLHDGRGARTVSVKLRMADFRIESRSATLPYATDDAETLLATAFKLVRYPEEVGPIRLVGVSYSGLEDALQDVLFPELDQVISAGSVTSDVEVGVSDYAEPVHATVTDSPLGWRATQDVYHPEYGHGWIQGTGHGWVTVRFETRATGPGRAVSLRVDDPLLTPADPIDSLAWDEWLGQEGG